MGPWVDVADAAAHMQAGRSIALLCMGGTGKTFFANEQAQHLTCRIYAVAKTHVAVAGLHIEGATKCTLAALQRRYVAQGASEVPCVCIVDEISLCTTQDFRTALELRKLGCALCLIWGPFLAVKCD